jgi:signal transduction histidine kinase/CheY-like chemotaxis protein
MISKLIHRYIFSEELPLYGRILNMVCCFGIIAAIMATIARIITQVPPATIFVMVIMTLGIVTLLITANTFKVYKTGAIITLIAVGDIFLPAVFLTMGSVHSGMAAYFAMGIILVFLLSHGITRVCLLSVNIIVTIASYIYCASITPGTYEFSELVKICIEHLQSLFVAGFFIGFVIVFQNYIYLKEKEKVEENAAKITRQDKLLHALNSAAAAFLAPEDTNRQHVLDNGAALIAHSANVDRLYLWKNIEENGILYFRRIYEWWKDESLRQEKPVNFSYKEALPNWEPVLNDGQSINGPVSGLPDAERDLLNSFNIKSILVVPIFIENRFWGFTSFEDSQREQVFPEDVEHILRSGSLLLANAFIRSIMETERAEALEQAVQASKAKGDFLSNMSHEMRTPMNAIIGMTAIGKSADGSTSCGVEKKDYAFQKIEDASTHLLGVINDILDMSKIEANKLELSLEEFDFKKLVKRTIDVINFRIEERKQRFNLYFDKNIPCMLLGDDQRIAQIVTNLLSNAVKFTPEEGTIAMNVLLVKHEKCACTIKVEIQDSGIGITREQQEKLFCSFQQAESGTSRKFGGTGLGLAISKRLAELMNGTIGVESEPGQGSLFWFVVTLEEVSSGQTATAGAGREKPVGEAGTENFDGCRLLLAEDMVINREIVIAMLEGYRLEIDCAENGREAVEKFRQNPGAYDMIFMDIQMPEVDGFEATRQIRAWEARLGKQAASRIPIIAMTANVFREDIEKCLQAGMDGHTGKPLDFEEVRLLLKKYLSKKNRGMYNI